MFPKLLELFHHSDRLFFPSFFLQQLTGHVDRGQSRLMSIWGDVVTLRRHCHTVKTATDRDLWELRAEFSRLSSSLLSHCGSVVSLSLRPSDPTTSLHPAPRSASAPPHSSTPGPPPLSSTPGPPPLSSTLGPLFLQDLDHDQKEREREREETERELTELRSFYEAETLHLNNRISELSRTIQDQKKERQEEERKMERGMALEKKEEREKERQRNTERTLECVYQAVLKLVRLTAQIRIYRESIQTP
uniref:Rootletin-like coiled-coil domain-containing protein n=1 Tax=Hucho hucho TaxID=62062 RepID=A0A4W5REN4_9TELE